VSNEHESLQREGLSGAAGATRRGFLRTAGLVTGGLGLFGLAPGRARAQDDPENCAPPTSPNPPVPFAPDTSQPVLPRKSAFELSSSEIQLLQDAYGALRELTQKNPNDPRGWQQQANVHCWYCGGGQDGQAGPEIHGSYRFFPWHRCYLYYHERILGKLVGNPNFRLPYWDWSDPSDRTLPPPYTNPNSSSNPLFDAHRGASPTDQIPARYVGPEYMQTRILQTTSWRVFMGTDVSAGNLENGPHGLVHIWVGDPTLQAANEDMGVLATAAQDPVFFAHHSNIDRYWDVWLQMGDGRTNPTDSGWATQTWTFYDENSVLRSITAGDVVNFEQNLRYTYGAGAAATQVKPLLSLSTQQNSVLGPEPLTRKVAVPGAVRTRLMGETAEVARPRPLVLHIEGIEHAPTQASVVHVFANKPGATAASELSGDNFLGYFAIVPNSLRKAHSHGEAEVVFDVSDTVRNLLAGQGDLSVTLVPATAQGKPKETQIVFDEIYLATE
jgi:polyphenol oxidase